MTEAGRKEQNIITLVTIAYGTKGAVIEQMARNYPLKC